MASVLEQMMVHPEYMGIPATDVQRAICRIADGEPLDELLERPGVLEMCGQVAPPVEMPRVLMLICAIRTGKSMFASGLAIRAAMSCDLSRVRANEPMARIPVLATDKDKARVVFDHLAGFVEASKWLGPCLESKTAERLVLRRSDGKRVEIVVTAASRHGSTLVGRWLAGAIFDEATLMTGDDDSVVDLAEMIAQCTGRLLPGAQIVLIGSTMAPPRGPAYELLGELWGRPSKGRVALWSTGPEMAPFRYTPDYVEELRRTDPDQHKVCIERVFLDPETGFLTAEAVDRVTRASGDLPPEEGHHYVAGTDPATRKNAWSLVVMDCCEDLPTKYRVVLRREWVPPRGERLSPRRVIAEMAELVKPYGVDVIHSDHHLADANADFAEANGIGWSSSMLQGNDARDAYLLLAELIGSRRLELPNCPTMARDLLGIKKVVNQDGSLSFRLAKTADGRHCDYVPALLRCVRALPDPPDEKEEERSEMDKHWSRVIEEQKTGDAEGMNKRMRRLMQ